MALNIRSSPTLALAEDIAAGRRQGKDILSLSTPSFPNIEIPAEVLSEGANRLTPAEGLPELREAARENMFGKWQLPDHGVFISAGAKLAIFSALKGLLQPASRVLVVEPAWPSYIDFVELAGNKAKVYATAANDNFRIEAAALEQALEKSRPSAILLSNPGNPTGRVYSGNELELLLSAAERYDAYLMIDESFSEIVFDRPAWRSAVTRKSPNVVLFNSFSKNFHLQGLRVAVCMANQKLLPILVGVHQTLVSSAPSASQQIALNMLKQDNREDPAKTYNESRALAAGIIRDAGWQCSPNEGSFYFFPQLLNGQASFDQMRQAGLFALEGKAFGKPYKAHMRFCFGKPIQEMKEIRNRLASAGFITK